MKRIISILIIIIVVMLVACDLRIIDDALNSNDSTEGITNSNMIEPEDESTRNNDSQSMGDVQAENTIISFSSFEEIVEFIEAVDGNSKQYSAFAEKNSTIGGISQHNAKKMANNILKMSVPTVNGSLEKVKFGASYYAERQELDVVYIINEVKYRFIFACGEVEPLKRSDMPALKDVPISSTSINMYKNEGNYLGRTTANDIVITVIVYSEEPSMVSFNEFDFVMIETAVN